MELQRNVLLAALFILGVLLWNAWEKEHLANQTVMHQQNSQAIPMEATASAGSTNMPPISAVQNAQKVNAVSARTTALPMNQTVTPATRLIHVKTDTLNIAIDRLGGNLVRAELLKYPQQVNHPEKPVVLFNQDSARSYEAVSGLVGNRGPDNLHQGQALYTSLQKNYEMNAGDNQLQVVLHWQDSKGLRVEKILTFHRDRYVVDVAYQVQNKGTNVWQGHLYNELKRKAIKKKKGMMAGMNTFMGAAVSSPEKPYQKISFKKMGDEPLSQNIKGGWAAMLEHYFISAWVPPADQTAHYYTRKLNDEKYAIGFVGQSVQVEPGQQSTINTQLYLGPVIGKRLEAVSPHLKLTVDYGMLWFISIILLWIMRKIHWVVGNWGWSIVLVTLFIKLLFYKLSATSYRSMARMRALQPKMDRLKERYGDDKQEFSKATMELYKKEKVNPFGGCLPIIIQIPVFLGLYWVLLESVELRQAPFILWIQDLSAKDPFFVLPVLMGISMFVQQKMSPTPPDPMQAKLMMMLPIIFTFFFLNFPAGLVLYWFVNNTLSILQQWWITHNIQSGKKA